MREGIPASAKNTWPLKPTLGKSVKVELLGAATVRDGFNITEVADQKNASTGDERQGRGTLNIVEVEFYESAR
jgi:hypothetical protein